LGFIKLSALMSLIGGIIGLVILLRMAGKPQAGLPFLNTPTIAGYFLSQLF
jgi:presenilin-like A22 family membrane protease